MDADGQNQVPLTANSTGEFEPAFSPDGAQIAFSSDREGDFEVFVMDADGQNQAPLTADPGSDFEPDWQPLNAARLRSLGFREAEVGQVRERHRHVPERGRHRDPRGDGAGTEAAEGNDDLREG